MVLQPIRKLRLALILAILLTQLFASGPAGPLPAQAAQQPGLQDDPVEVGAFLDGAAAIQMAAHHIPGMVIAVVKDGQVLYTQGYGYADLAQNIPVDPQQTLFRPGSISKLFTFTALMQLVEQGRVSLEEDVNAYLDFTIPATYPAPITLRHLLTHTPGFEDTGQGLFTLDPEGIIPLGTLLKEHIPARVYPPGEVIAYSNYGAALAGYIVERVSGQPFHQYVAEHIFQPLGMTRSTFVQPLPDELAPAMARGYNFYNNEYVTGGFEIVQLYPAGSLSATADDLTRFMIAHLQDGQYEGARILSEDTARLMHSPLYSPDPRLHSMAHGFFESEVNGQTVISHGGDTVLFHSGLFLLPEQALGIYISTNAVGGSSAPRAIFDAFMERYFPVPPQARSDPPADFAARAPLYTGEYYMSRGNFTTLEKFLSVFNMVRVRQVADGQVIISMPGLGAVRYREVEPGLLEADEGLMPTVVLEVAPSGQVFLLSSLPWFLIKAPWYATSTVTLLIFAGGLLLFLGTLIAWLSGALARWRGKRARQLVGARLARLTAGLFMLVFLIIMAGLFAVVADIDPAFGVPRLVFEEPVALKFMVSLVPLLYGLGGVALVFAVLAWVKRYWTAGGRLFYSLLVAWFGIVLWAMAFWNLLMV